MISEQTANFMNPQYPPTILGGAAFSKYVDEIKMETKKNKEGLLILDGGNFFQGNSIGLLDKGKTIIEWMNLLDYDAITLGPTVASLTSSSNEPELVLRLMVLFFFGTYILLCLKTECQIVF